MMRTIYNYRDIRRLEQSTIYSELENGIIVTATAALAEAMREYYPTLCVLDIHFLINELIPEWDDTRKDVHNYIALRNAMDNYMSEHENDGNLVLSLKRNASDIWNAILLLVEADVYPNDIPNAADKLALTKHFRGIWEQFEIEDNAIMNFRAQFAYRMKNNESVKDGIRNALRDRKYGEERYCESIYLLGFYFITPIQARIFDSLELVGYQLAYLNGYDSNYPEMCKIWEHTFESEYNEKVYTDIQPTITLSNAFGEVAAGSGEYPEVDVKKYSSNMEFAQAIKEPLANGAEIYTPDRKNCESILKEYYPGLFEHKHLLAYPVGQYIYYLHLMWNGIHNRLEMKYDYVFKCFATGMLEDDLANGKDYLYELSQLEIMFKDCVSFDKWRERLDNLLNAKENISVFEIEETDNKRWHELMGNPFNSMSVYSVSSDKLQTIDALIRKLMADAEYLFAGEEKTSLKNHFSKITKLINEHISREDVLEDEEALAKELIENLNEASVKDTICPIDAVRDALVMLLGNHFDEEVLEPDIDVNDQIKPFTMIEASMMTNYGQDIYLVLADEFTLPGKAKMLPWPITDKFIAELDISEREESLKYVRCMRSVIENKRFAYRYLFFSFMSNINESNSPRLHISWVKNQGNKKANASQYTLIINPDANKIKDTSEDVDFEAAINSATVEYGESVIGEPGRETPIEVQYDYSLCRFRYLYSYLLQLYPTYKSEFHYSFLLSSLIRGLYTETGKSKNEVSQELFELFPFLRTIEQRQAYDFVGKRNERDIEVFDNAQYAASRLDVHYLNPQFKEKVIRSFEGEDIEITAEEKCRYCPHTNVCIYKRVMAEEAQDE